jgi:hypothetical protein
LWATQSVSVPVVLGTATPTTNPVPLPAAAPLLAAALGVPGLIGWRRRRAA